MSRNRALVLAVVLGLTITTAPAYAATPKPTLAQIEAAKKAEAAKKKGSLNGDKIANPAHPKPN